MKFVKKVCGSISDVFKDVAVGTAEWFKKQTQELEKWLKNNTEYDINWSENNTLINIDSSLEKKIPIQLGEDSKDTINVYVNAPVKFNLNYNLVLQAGGSVVEKPDLKRFEASVDGRFNFEPEVRIGFDGKLELPEDKQKLKLVEFDGITIVFTIGYVPFSVDFNPSMFLKFDAELGGQATVGVKYELDSWFKGGIKYDGYGDPKGISESKVTKSKVSFITPTAEFTAKAGVGLMFGCDIIIDKLAGPEIAIGPKLQAKAGLTIAPFEEDPVDFNASVDFGLIGEVGAKIKVWKWELAEWHTDLDFGLNWNIFKYPKDNSNGDKDAEDYCNDNFVEENVKEITKNVTKNLEKLAEEKAWVELSSKLRADSEIDQVAKQYLKKDKFKASVFMPIEKTANVFNQKLAIIDYVHDIFIIKNGNRAPKDNDADFQTLKKMTIDKIKTIKKRDLEKILMEYDYI